MNSGQKTKCDGVIGLTASRDKFNYRIYKDGENIRTYTDQIKEELIKGTGSKKVEINSDGTITTSVI